MLARLAADLVVLLHLGFILFVVFGGLGVLHAPRLAWLHLPAAAWGALVELLGLYCPLTDWENALRRRGAEQGYADSFIEHYLMPLIYPAALTEQLQLLLGLAVLLINGGIYGWLLWRRRRPHPR
ncbi:MAG: DUF2784 domain-containing protein [Trichloromonadaceae bacterium]